MMGLPGSTPETFRNDLQECIDRDVRVPSCTRPMLLANSPMNEPEYREENGIVARPGEEVQRERHVHPRRVGRDDRLRTAFWLFENFGVLRQVATYVRAETGQREIDFYERLVDDVHDAARALADDGDHAAGAARADGAARQLALFLDEVRRYLVERGRPGRRRRPRDRARGAARARCRRATVRSRSRSSSPTTTRPGTPPWPTMRDDGHLERLARTVSSRCASTGRPRSPIDDPLDSCQRCLGPTYTFLSEDSAWDLASPVSRPRQAEDDPRKVVA